jgi:hypothetical protein
VAGLRIAAVGFPIPNSIGTMSAVGSVAPPFLQACGLRQMADGWRKRMETMPDRLTSALLAALNESTEMKESDWRQPERALQGQFDEADSRPGVEPKTGSENRFAATICSGMAKVRSNF